MPRIVNWLLRLVITNPICMRLVTGGSRRTRHLYIRSGYLAVMIIALLISLLGVGQGSLQKLASAGATAFQQVAYLQLGMICLLAPVFMAGAIAQEANPRTWDILLTTPLNALQVVLGNLFGRLFFIMALLVSSLPLFAITQYFGGVPGRSIFMSYLIGAIAALVVGSIAIALSVSRQAGRRAVFVFYICVVVYLGLTWSIDRILRPGAPNQVTMMTPLNPFLTLEVLLNYANYHPPSAVEQLSLGWFKRMWFGAPAATFCWLGTVISVLLIAWSALFLRVIGERTGQIAWYRRLFRAGSASAKARPARRVWNNPIAWREASAKQNTLGKQVAKWGFVGLGVLIAMTLIGLIHTQTISLGTARSMILSVIAIEVGIIGLTALNISATAISQEREDGTLDLLLTTPLTPSYYVSGKMRGIVSFLLPMIAVPTVTLAMMAAYIGVDGLGVASGVMMTVTANTSTVEVPMVLPEGVIILPLVLTSYSAFAVMVGLHWSLKSKGTISSIIGAVGIVVAVTGVISLCGSTGGKTLGPIRAVLATISPITAVRAIVFPEAAIPDSLSESVAGSRITLVVASCIAAAVYGFVVYGMHKQMLGPNGRNFDMTVRRLSGTN
ncbi:MAG: ABC transporter permease subunit [Planctomycetes bacterium]|nr:ABC transporter permease subunit [Planctomycetota bacterium]